MIKSIASMVIFALVIVAAGCSEQNDQSLVFDRPLENRSIYYDIERDNDVIQELRALIPGEAIPHEMMVSAVDLILAFSRGERDTESMLAIELILLSLNEGGTPGASVILDALAQAYGELGDPDRGLAILEWLGEPRDIRDSSIEDLLRSDHHGKRARLLAEQGDDTGALQAYEEAIAIVPFIPDFRPGSIRSIELEFLHALEQAGRHEDAVDYALLRARASREAGVPSRNEQLALQRLRHAAEAAGDAQAWREAVSREIELLDQDGSDASGLVMELMIRDRGVERDGLNRPIPRDDVEGFLLDAAAALLPYAGQGHAAAFDQLEAVLQGYALAAGGAVHGGRLSESTELVHQEIALAAHLVLGDPESAERFEILRGHYEATQLGARSSDLSERLGTKGRATAGIDVLGERRVRRIGASSAVAVAREAERRGSIDMARWYYQLAIEIAGDSSLHSRLRENAINAIVRLSE